jgi:hypothetical protein
LFDEATTAAREWVARSRDILADNHVLERIQPHFFEDDRTLLRSPR